MPKTKNACAIRDIQANPYNYLFKNLNVDGKIVNYSNIYGEIDEKIFQTIISVHNHLDSLKYPEAEEHFKLLDALQYKADTIRERLWKHLRYRLTLYAEKLLKISVEADPQDKEKLNILREKRQRTMDFIQMYEELEKKIVAIYSEIGKRCFELECVQNFNYRHSFAERLKQFRADNKLSQRQLAAKVGIPQSDIAQYEVEKKLPSLLNVVKIIKMTGVDAKWLLGV